MCKSENNVLTSLRAHDASRDYVNVGKLARCVRVPVPVSSLSRVTESSYRLTLEVLLEGEGERDRLRRSRSRRRGVGGGGRE